MFKLFWFLGAMSASAVNCYSYNNIDPTAVIDSAARLGSYLSIGRDVTIGARSQVKNYASIAPNTAIAEDALVGSYSNIGQGCAIANQVKINNYVTTGHDSIIGSGSVLLNYATIGNNVALGKHVKVEKYSTVTDRAQVGDEAILDRYSAVGNNAAIRSKAYIGAYSKIQPDATVNELAVIHMYVDIPRGTTIKPSEVVIRSPSSYEMYQECEPVENISPADIDIAANRNTESISPEFNRLLRQLIDSEMNSLKTSCDKTNNALRPDKLWLIRSLYLIQFHGLDGFKENIREVQQVQRFGNEWHSFSSMLVNQLDTEFHFGANSARNILESDVKKKLVQLLAIEQDDGRENRVENDSNCRMFEQIRTEEREVTCAKRSYGPN